MPSTLLFAVNNEGRVFGLSTNGTKWREFVYLGLEFKHLSAIPHFLWAVGGDRQVYVHVHGLDIPIRIKEESYENERWTPFDGFSEKLLPTDRYRFSNQDGTKDRALKKIRLPSMAWQWEGDWHLELTHNGQPLDHDGWTYAVDFPATYYSKKQWTSCVRRRKWCRYRRYSALNSWCAIAPLHKDPTREPFIGVAVGGHQLPGGNAGITLVWAVTAHGRVMFRTDVSTVSPEGQRWTCITMPPGCEVSQVSVGPTGLVWVVLWNGNALARTGVTRGCLTGDNWTTVEQPGEGLPLNQVSVGKNGVWAISRNHRVWFRKGVQGESAGVSEELAKGSGWVEMFGDMATVSVACNDQVWAVGAEDRLLYFRTSVTAEDLTGKTWRLVGAPTQLSRTSSTVSLFSGSQVGGTPREGKRHRSWTSLNRHSGSHEAQARLDLDLEEACHSAPVMMRTTWHKTTDGSSVKSFGSQSVGSDSSGVASSLPDHTITTLSEDTGYHQTGSGSGSGDLHHDILEVKAREEGGSSRGDDNDAYEGTSHPVVGFTQKEHSIKKQSGRAWSPLRSVGSIVGVEAHSEADSSVFESDPLAGIYSEAGEREEDDDHLYWADSEALWSCVEAGACLVDVNHLPKWFAEVDAAPKVDLGKPWRVQILTELKRRPPDGFPDLGNYEKAVDTSSWLKSTPARCLLSGETTYQDCLLELEWVTGGATGTDCGTLTLSSLDKANTRDQINMAEVSAVVRCSEPRSPRIAVFRGHGTGDTASVRVQFTGEDELEEWMAELSSVCGNIRAVAGPPAPGSLWATTALGDVYAFDPTYLSSDQLREETGLYSVEVSLGGATLPRDIPLHGGFLPGSKIHLTGCVHDNADRFAVDLMCYRDCSPPDVALHFNPRIKDDIVVRNAKKNGVWGPEDRRGCQPFTPGATFTMEVECCERSFRVLVNDKIMTDFNVRDFSSGETSALGPVFITHLGLTGDVTFTKLRYSSTAAIFDPSAMFWRHIGGHLRKVESAGGVTWGIGFDSTAWMYTGGCGGPYISALDSSNSHPMSDSHKYYVYENQRWNPLTGYTSHGLPTDRFMWSDVTGRHKRTRENTQLLSKRWQWVTAWVVDYHTPGGVDKEGWQYAVDFPASYHGKKHLTDYVRRRRWVRQARLNTHGPWVELGNTCLLDCSLHVDDEGAVVAWAVAANGDVLYRRGVSVSCPSGISWEPVLSDQIIVSVSSGPGQLWTIGKSGTAFWRFGITNSNPLGDAWETVESPKGATLKQVSIGQKGVWALDDTGRLSVRKEVSRAFPAGSHWQTLSLLSSETSSQDEPGLPSTPLSVSAGGVRHMSAKSDVWAITSSGSLAHRLGIHVDNAAGSAWTCGVDANWIHVSLS